MFLCMVAGAGPLSAAIEVGGTIVNDTVWTSADTILATDSVIVAGSATLTIEAGAVIMFSAGKALSVQGELAADGLAAGHILFTSRADTAGGTPAAGTWSGLGFEENSIGTLAYCTVRYAVNGIYIDRASVALTGCTIEDFLSVGLWADGYYLDPPMAVNLTGCTIRQNDAALIGTAYGAYVYRSVDVTMNLCEISRCDLGLVFLGQGTTIPHFQISRCEIREHSTRAISALGGG